MKKLITLLSVLLISSITGFAQMVDFRIEAGPSFNFNSFKTFQKESFNRKNKTGYHVGAYVDFPVNNGLYLSSGLTFTMKGARNENALAANDITLHYLQIPLSAGYKFNVSSSIAVALQTGPYFSFALAGTAKTGSSLKNLSHSYNIFKDGLTSLGDNFKARRYDVGWNVAGLLFFGRYYGTVGLDFGFLNVFNNSESGSKLSEIKDKVINMHNAQCYIGLGVCF